jgi:hypothetical protein
MVQISLRVLVLDLLARFVFSKLPGADAFG